MNCGACKKVFVAISVPQDLLLSVARNVCLVVERELNLESLKIIILPLRTLVWLMKVSLAPFAVTWSVLLLNTKK